MSLPKPEYDPDYDVVIRVYYGYNHTDRLLERLAETGAPHRMIPVEDFAKDEGMA